MGKKFFLSISVLGDTKLSELNNKNNNLEKEIEKFQRLKKNETQTIHTKDLSKKERQLSEIRKKETIILMNIQHIIDKITIKICTLETDKFNKNEEMKVIFNHLDKAHISYTRVVQHRKQDFGTQSF